VDLSAAVGGRFPDELGPEEIQALKEMVASLSQEFGLLYISASGYPRLFSIIHSLKN
jgi:hypothetical protein